MIRDNPYRPDPRYHAVVSFVIAIILLIVIGIAIWGVITL